MRGERMRVGEGGSGVPDELAGAAADLARRDRYADLRARALPGHPAPRLRLQPRRAAARERLQRRARAGRHRRHLRHRARGDGAPRSTARPAATLLVARLPRRLPRRGRSRARGAGRTGRSASRASTSCLIEDMTMHGKHAAGPRPASRGPRLAAGRVRRRHDGRGRRQGAALLQRDLERARRRACAASRSTTTRTSEQHVWEVRESGLGATAFAARRARHVARAGRTRRSRPSGWASTCARCASSTERYGYRSALYGHFGQGCVHCAHQLRPRHRRGHRRLPPLPRTRPPTSSSALGGSLSGEHGDGQSRAELLPKMFGHELVEAFREFKAIWDPDGR